MIRTRSRFRFRRTLMLSTALAGGGAFAASPGGAQTLPTSGDVVSTATNPGGTAPTVGNPNATTLQVDLKAKSTLINWNGFNVPVGNTANFTDATSGIGNLAVLNRDVNGTNPSQILGALNAPGNVTVYVVNPVGVIFGAGSSVNVGALIASSLDLDAANQSAFLNGATSLTFAGPASATGGVTVNGSLTATSSSGLGHLVLLGPAISMSGASLSGSGDVAVVAGTDITVTSAGSPLSFVINQGTTVNNAIAVNGTVNGRNVTFAAARPAALLSTLLGVSGTVTATGAAATDHGIVLLGGQSGPGVTVSQPSTNIDIDASGATFVSAKDATFATGGDVNIGSVKVAGDYAVTAATFHGNALAPILTGTGSDFTVVDTAGGLSVGALSAPGTLSITTQNGGLTVGGNLASTNEGIALNGATGIQLNGVALTSPGSQALTGAVTLAGSNGLTASGSGSTVTFNGTVNASAPSSLTVSSSGGTVFNGSVGGSSAPTTVTVSGPATLNAAKILATNGITLGSLTLGASAPAAVQLDAGTGALSVASITAATADANDLTLGGSTIGVGNVGIGGRLKSVTFNAPTTLSGNVAAANAAAFLGALTLTGSGLRKITAGSATFQTVDSAVADTSGLSVDTGSGSVTFSGPVGAAGRLGGLAIKSGTASFSGTNKVDLLAADVGSGGFSFTNGSALILGTLDGLSGIKLGTGAVSISTTGPTSDLTVAQAVTATSGPVALTSSRDIAGAGSVGAGGTGNGVTLAAAAGTIALTGTVTAPGTIAATALNSLSLGGAASSGGDVNLRSNLGNVAVAGTVSGVDVAIKSAGTIVTGAITAQDDIVLRSTGSTTTGALTAAIGADADGAGDALFGGANSLAGGGDIDVAANGISIGGLVRATTGSGSDIRLSGGGGGVGDLTRNLDLAAGGNVVVSGPGRGIDILIAAATGNLTADALTATGNATLSAGNILTLNAPVALTSGDLTMTATDWGGVALTNPMTGGDDLTIVDLAGGLSVGPLTAPGTLSIKATNGTLTVTGTLASTNEGIDLTTTGNNPILLNGRLTTGLASGRTVTLSSGGGIFQMNGTSITTDLLTGAAVGGAIVGSSTNSINRVAFAADSLFLRNSGPLTVAGAVTGPNGVDVATLSGDLTVNAPVTTTGGAISLAGAANLAVNSAVGAGSGPISLTGSSGAIGLGANVSTTGTVTLNAGTTVTQTAGVLSAGTLTGASAGATSLVASTNQVGTLGNFSAGSFALNDGGGLAVAGAVTGTAGVSIATSGLLSVASGGSIGATNAPISLTASGASSSIALAGPVNAGTGLVTLVAGNAIGQSGSGVVTAGTLTGSSGGATNLATLVNQIGNLGPFTAAGFALRDAGGLTVAGTVDGTSGGVAIETSGDLIVNAGILAANAAIGLVATGANSDISLNAPVNAGTGTVTLTANGAGGTIGQTASGVITAGLLTGSSNGATTLTAALNQLAALGPFSATGFALRNDPALTVSGPVTAGSGALSLEVVGDPLAVNANLTGTGVTLKATGISQAAGSVVNAGAGSILVDADDGAINMAGTLTTTNGGASAVRIIDSGNAVLGTIATGAGGTVTLGGAAGDSLSGTVTQTAGTAITAGTLTGNVGSAILANAGNDVTTLAAFTTGSGFVFTDANTLAVSGPVDAGTGNLILNVTTGPLTLAGDLTAATGSVALTAPAGPINQTGGRIKAAALTGLSAGGASLNSATNDIVSLAGFSNSGAGGISLVDGRSLTVTATVNSGAGNLSIKAPGIAFNGQTLTSGANILLDAQTGALAGSTATAAGNLTGTGASIDIAAATATGGALALTAAGGQLTLGTGNAGTTATLTKNGAGGELQVTTSLTAGNAAANGDATLTSSTSARLANVTSKTGNVSVTALAGDVTGVGPGRANLAAQGAAKDVTVRAGGLALLGTVAAGQDVTVTAGLAASSPNGSIDATALAGRDIALDARAGGVTLGTATARDDIAIRATGAVAATSLASGVTVGSQGPVDAAGAADTLVTSAVSLTGNDIDVRGSAVTVGTASAAGAGSDLRLTANSGNLSLASGTAAQDVALRASTGSAQVGTAAAGRDLAIAATDLDIATAATAAATGSATFTQLGSGPLRLGDATPSAGGFSLTQAEVNRIAAGTVTFDPGANNVEIGTLALGDSVGATQFTILGTARFDVTGAFSTGQASTSRTVRLGGDGGTGEASVIRVAATAAGGGRLLMGNSNVDLRGRRIGVGEDDQFLTALGLTPTGTPVSPAIAASSYVGNAASRLYNPAVPYSNGIVLTANRLTVRYSDYALFQNTAVGGAPPRGAQIGSLGVTNTLALSSSGTGASTNGFALFGEINGRGGAQAALLGPTVIGLSAVSPGDTRINGCLVGSGGGGCLISVVATPALNIFDQSQANLIRVANALPLPFDPVVGANNEALFSGLSAIDAVTAQPKCEEGEKGAACRAAREDHP
ncbi:MAG: filamentous hemagglutinin N-terminal domain-containing protein [Alphaproteobacteria bacterium]|nr:filamentous hemagglutinin N-terminal domain-containing protein [Alphaproteobacteria bacterium]